MLLHTFQTSSMDSMFNGLGLGNYVNQDKGNLVNSVIGCDGKQTSNKKEGNVTKSTSNQSLSLQDKQRLLAEQEKALNQSKEQPSMLNKPINPQGSIINKSVSLNQISSSSNVQIGTTYQAHSLFSSSNMSGTPFNVNPQGTSNSSFGNFAQASGATAATTPFNPTYKGSTGKPDLSAFDSLMSTSPFQGKPSMNSIKGKNTVYFTLKFSDIYFTAQSPGLGLGGMQPLQPTISGTSAHWGTNNNGQSKPLSTNEIDDLLS